MSPTLLDGLLSLFVRSDVCVDDDILYNRLTIVIPAALRPGMISESVRVTSTARAILSADEPVRNAATICSPRIAT